MCGALFACVIMFGGLACVGWNLVLLLWRPVACCATSRNVYFKLSGLKAIRIVGVNESGLIFIGGVKKPAVAGFYFVCGFILL